jgi:hypothetical protein
MCKIPNAAGINISVIGHDKIPVPLSKSTALTFSRRYLLVYTCKFGSTLVKYIGLLRYCQTECYMICYCH